MRLAILMSAFSYGYRRKTVDILRNSDSHDYPNWQNVRYHYDIWAKPDDDGISVLNRILRKLVEMEREINDRSVQTTMIIVDSKNNQNSDTLNKGFHAGKNKLHIGV